MRLEMLDVLAGDPRRAGGLACLDRGMDEVVLVAHVVAAEVEQLLELAERVVAFARRRARSIRPMRTSVSAMKARSALWIGV